jgi:S-adenosylmethionine synthetase
MVKDNIVIVAGELGGVSISKYKIKEAAMKIADELNYKIEHFYNFIGQQSLEIHNAVDAQELGAGDQGMVYGYATKETDTYLPLGFDLANKIIKILEDDVPNGILKGDAKCQVTVDLDTKEIHTILISACHNGSLDDLKIHIKNLIKELPQPKHLIINPAGEWHIGGPTADSGLTGRKIVADQYGGYCAVGGGAFSGKDLSKVDRSGAYFARNMAIKLLNQYDLDEIEIQVAYAIGQAEPISIYTNPQIDIAYNLFKPANMIKSLGNLDYKELAKGCHYRYGKIQTK